MKLLITFALTFLISASSYATIWKCQIRLPNGQASIDELRISFNNKLEEIGVYRPDPFGFGRYKVETLFADFSRNRAGFQVSQCEHDIASVYPESQQIFVQSACKSQEGYSVFVDADFGMKEAGSVITQVQTPTATTARVFRVDACSVDY
ncbi:hypothetical protein AZI87_00770 [Bdellovibrio bacteriovorus]|uniref:Uncharacterized protein n=1 Tax=Bdellovibrio bacteriovorus TaxID=959 RepID=A0A161PSY6_BDEBC|nr:hypothetical protein [Bdellovibrio bacteriovorus]KYG67846.1 hypothetical protein AZI87_00770 [Bdellovibrio bacteriovorus]